MNPPPPPPSQFFNVKTVPIMLLDYIWVLTIYVTAAFWLAVLIDGHILPRYDTAKTEKKGSILLYVEIILQLGLQGFMAIFMALLLSKIPSPFNGINGYTTNSPDGLLIRNPAIITFVLLTLLLLLTLRPVAYIIF